MKTKSFVAGTLIGGLVCGASALLFAPQAGHKTRKQLKDGGKKLSSDVSATSKKLCDKTVHAAKTLKKHCVSSCKK